MLMCHAVLQCENISTHQERRRLGPLHLFPLPGCRYNEWGDESQSESFSRTTSDRSDGKPDKAKTNSVHHLSLALCQTAEINTDSKTERDKLSECETRKNSRTRRQPKNLCPRAGSSTREWKKPVSLDYLASAERSGCILRTGMTSELQLIKIRQTVESSQHHKSFALALRCGELELVLRSSFHVLACSFEFW
ncbi:uncharacterized protein V6R79_002123 [Siganus canaliculatus]